MEQIRFDAAKMKSLTVFETAMLKDGFGGESKIPDISVILLKTVHDDDYDKIGNMTWAEIEELGEALFAAFTPDAVAVQEAPSTRGVMVG